jgi:ribonuclease-3
MLYLLHELEDKIGYVFQDIDLLRRALTHPSYAAEKKVDRHNQRLEFLGDAVLQLGLTRRLFLDHPDADEGVLSRLRAAVAREEALAEVAGSLDLGKYIRLGRGEKLTGGHERSSTLADCVEAIFGAVYLDGGYEAGLRVVGRLTDFLVERGEELLAESNPKGRLQELTQQRMQLRPVYEVVDIDGPEHEPQFTVTVSVGDEVQGRAIAGSRRKAEIEAARQALKALQGG